MDRRYDVEREVYDVLRALCCAPWLPGYAAWWPSAARSARAAASGAQHAQHGGAANGSALPAATLAAVIVRPAPVEDADSRALELLEGFLTMPGITLRKYFR